MAGATPEVRRALTMFPSGLFLMTAAFDSKRAGHLVGSVQPCADEPPLVSVVARKGHSIEPLIRDSHCFAVCRIDAEDKLIQRKFGPAKTPDALTDPFDSLELDRLVTGSPIVRRSIVAIDCQVVRHLDLEADHELYIGLVVAARVYARTP